MRQRRGDRTGLIHLALGDPPLAIEWLERGYAERDHQMVFLKGDPRLDPLRDRRDFRPAAGADAVLRL